MSHCPWDLVTFDCYGTLIDWEGGIAAAFEAEAKRRDRPAPERNALLGLYHTIEPAIQAGRFRAYRDVLTETAARIAERLAWPPGNDTFLADSVPDWQPFPDTNAALSRIRSLGCRLGILSNVDADLLERTCTHFRVPFDFVVTAGEVRAYKPADPHFLAARERAGADRWLHAAQSWFHDVVPARRLDIPVVWVNRRAESLPGDVRPTGVVSDLGGLAHWLAS